MPVSDIAKIAAMFNDNPVSQVSAYRKDAQDFYTAPDRVALDNAKSVAVQLLNVGVIVTYSN